MRVFCGFLAEALLRVDVQTEIALTANPLKKQEHLRFEVSQTRARIIGLTNFRYAHPKMSVYMSRFTLQVCPFSLLGTKDVVGLPAGRSFEAEGRSLNWYEF